MKITWVLVLFAGIIFFSALLVRSRPQEGTGTSLTFSTDFAYDNRTFLPAVAQTNPPEKGLVNAVIIPHHLLASSLISQGISLFVPTLPDTLIILSPNHENSGHCDIVSSKIPWNTPFGQIKVNTVLLDNLLDSRLVCLDDSVISREHGIAGLLPFINYYLPKTRIIPLAIKRDPKPESFEKFNSILSGLGSGAGIIASLDFSHGLSRNESLMRDEKTKGYISSFDTESIALLSSEYVDSPPVLISFLRYLEANHSLPKFIDHKDSSFFNDCAKNVTSYFLIRDHKEVGEGKQFSIIFGGDVMLGRTVNTKMNKYSDYSWPFKNISTILSSADLAIVNLESPFGVNCPLTDTGMVFCANPDSSLGLVSAGIDAVNLANNHIGNQGKVGYELTLTELGKKGIGVFGTGNPLIKEVKDIKIAFLGFNDITPHFSGISQATEENIVKQVVEAKKQSDLVITSFHWGSEYSRHGSRQTKFARLAIDSGADAVMGHHPHWIQDFEEYKGKPIYYSLGNLVFDQMWSENTRKGQLVKLTYIGKELIKREEFPIKIYDYGQPIIE